MPATLSALIACLETIGEFGGAAKLSPDIVGRARVVVEELFSNTIKYGYGRECDRPVRLTLTAAAGLVLVYEDEAPAFDPSSWRSAGPARSAAEAPRVGEAGLALLFGLSSSVAYETAAVGNRLVVTFAET